MMDIKFTQRYQEMNIGVRVPMFQTDYSRVYGMAGGRFALVLRAVHLADRELRQRRNRIPALTPPITPTPSRSACTARSSGAGTRSSSPTQFSVSLRPDRCPLLDVAKQRAKYELGDETVQSKWGREEFRLVPNANADLNLWWYPIEGVQIRVGLPGDDVTSTPSTCWSRSGSTTGTSTRRTRPSTSGSSTGSTSGSGSSSKPDTAATRIPIRGPGRRSSRCERSPGSRCILARSRPIATPPFAGIICPVPRPATRAGRRVTRAHPDLRSQHGRRPRHVPRSVPGPSPRGRRSSAASRSPSTRGSCSSPPLGILAMSFLWWLLSQVFWYKAPTATPTKYSTPRSRRTSRGRRTRTGKPYTNEELPVAVAAEAQKRFDADHEQWRVLDDSPGRAGGSDDAVVRVPRARTRSCSSPTSSAPRP